MEANEKIMDALNSCKHEEHVLIWLDWIDRIVKDKKLHREYRIGGETLLQHMHQEMGCWYDLEFTS